MKVFVLLLAGFAFSGCSRECSKPNRPWAYFDYCNNGKSYPSNWKSTN